MPQVLWKIVLRGDSLVTREVKPVCPWKSLSCLCRLWDVLTAVGAGFGHLLLAGEPENVVAHAARCLIAAVWCY